MTDYSKRIRPVLSLPKHITDLRNVLSHITQNISQENFTCPTCGKPIIDKHAIKGD